VNSKAKIKGKKPEIRILFTLLFLFSENSGQPCPKRSRSGHGTQRPNSGRSRKIRDSWQPQARALLAYNNGTSKVAVIVISASSWSVAQWSSAANAVHGWLSAGCCHLHILCFFYRTLNFFCIGSLGGPRPPSGYAPASNTVILGTIAILII